MAPKAKTDPGERSNRFRFVMLEADLSDSNVNALAQAIVSALRTEQPSTPKRLGPPVSSAGRLPAPAAIPANGDGDNDRQESEAVNEEAVSTEDESPTEATSPTPGKPKKPTKPTQPDYLPGLFPSAAEADSFKAFLAQHPTKKDSERYLVCALYLRDHGTPVVNMDTIYTCYRTAGDWQMTIRDWDVNLRNQIRNDRFRRAEGGYSLTTAGEAIVQTLRAKTV